MSNLEILQKMRDLCFEAANALWAIKRGKPTDRDPNLINQDIYNLRPEFDRVLEEMKQAEGN